MQDLAYLGAPFGVRLNPLANTSGSLEFACLIMVARLRRRRENLAAAGKTSRLDPDAALHVFESFFVTEHALSRVAQLEDGLRHSVPEFFDVIMTQDLDLLCSVVHGSAKLREHVINSLETRMLACTAAMAYLTAVASGIDRAFDETERIWSEAQ